MGNFTCEKETCKGFNQEKRSNDTF